MAVALTPKESQSSAPPADEIDGYTRLHITPFDADLLTVIVPAAVLPKARNISYHTLETFPEKRYGFVDLPTMDADKLKKKLNGAMLRGAKVRLDQAKPESIPDPTAAEEGDDGKSKKDKKEKKSKDKSDKSKKRKRDDSVIEGVQLEDRKVKRGWTVSEAEMIKEKRKEKGKKSKDKTEKKEKKKQKRELKSKYTEEPECLFKQKLPKVPDAKDEKDAEDDDGYKRKKRKSDRQVVVHEFANTTKHPSFLKSIVGTSTSESLKFEDGKGWVDATGNVVETAKSKRPASLPKSRLKKKDSPKPISAVEDDDETSSSGSSSEDESDAEEDESSDEEIVEIVETEIVPKKLSLDIQAIASPITALRNDTARPKSSGSTTSLTIKIPPTTPAKVHPLEALYKRSKGTEEAPGGSASESKPFSFFNDDDIEVDEDATMAPPSQYPMTPYTKEDFEFRNVRSAAPTPDTAHPSRSYNLWPRSGSADNALEEGEDDDEDDDEDEGEDEDEDEEKQGQEAGADVTMTGATQPAVAEDGSKPPTSEFQKWFWEHRGDLNRSWKKRRKTASKEKRNRENRARAARAI
jgi:hypothetical protein